MSKKQTWRDRKLKEIELWGQLTLFQFLKDKFDVQMEKERNIIFSFGAETHKGSNLETHDLFVEAVNTAWNREFKKLYNSIKNEK